MKNLFYSLLLLSLSLSSCSQADKSDLERCDLIGRVKSVTTASYEVYDKFGEGNLQKAKPNYLIVYITTFDSLGNMLVEKSISVEDVRRSFTTITNNQNQQVKWLCYEDDDDSKMQYGTNYYYDDRGNLIRENDLHNNSVTTYKNTYDSEGHLISQIGGPYKRFWEYSNHELKKHTVHFYDMTSVFLYQNGRIVKETYNSNTTSGFYKTYAYDEQGREIEVVVIENDNIDNKTKTIYSLSTDISPTEKIVWDADGAVEHDYAYTYFVVGNDTATIFNFDKENLENIEFYLKEPNGITKDIYKSSSNLLTGYQYIYENGNLVTRRDLDKGTEQKYVDGIVTTTEEYDDEITESKYKRNTLISRITKDKSGKIKYSFVIDGDDNKETITIINNGETKKGENIYENGKLVKYTEAQNGLTSTVSYNEDGHMSEIKNSDGTVWTYKYDFDSHGNWVKKTTCKNGKPSEITERSILYY